MNLDMNMLTNMLQLLGASKSPTQKSEQKIAPISNVSVFASQNGIGEKVNIGVGQEKSDLNPMLGLLQAMSGGEGSQMSSMLPMFMNMLSKKNAAPKVAEESAKAAHDETRKRVQKDKYAPILYAGYPLISALNTLYASKKM